jgi:hypothetical protein
MRRLTLIVLAATLLLMGAVALAPECAQAGPAGAPVSAKQATDPLVGNWYRGKRWFRVRRPSGGVYRVAWSNGTGKLIRYTIKRRSSGVYYETSQDDRVHERRIPATPP